MFEVAVIEDSGRGRPQTTVTPADGKHTED
jgi:hypothetical protein